MFCLQPCCTALSPMRRTIVHDPENTSRLTIGRLGHYVCHQAIERLNPVLRFASTKQFRPVDVEGGQIGPGTTPFVFMLHLHGRSRFWRKRLVFSTTRLDAGLLVGGQDEVVVLKWLLVPNSF